MFNKDDMIIHVTGGAGFIGSNLVRHLVNAGYKNITVIDDLTDGRKFRNLVGYNISYVDKDEYHQDVISRWQDGLSPPDYVFHLGAISSTTHKNGKELMENNYQYSIDLIYACMDMGIRIQYASSASVYGNETDGKEDPLNCYAFSKQMVDNFVRDLFESNPDGSLSQILGLRFFNCYGPNENHKDGQASPVYQFWKQVKETGKIKIFDVASKRDFVYVDDVCKMMLHLMQTKISGVIDVGTGTPRSFYEVAQAVCNALKIDISNDVIETIPFPKELEGHYQFFTKAQDYLGLLGYSEKLLTLDQGVALYVAELEHRARKNKKQG